MSLNHTTKKAFFVPFSIAMVLATAFITEMVCRADDGATTSPEISKFHAPQGVNDSNILIALAKANEMVATSNELVNEILMFAKTGSKFASPSAHHHGANCIQINCLMRDGQLSGIQCNNTDGYGFGLDNIINGKVCGVTTTRFGKPDGFSVQFSESGMMTYYIEFHEGMVLGKAINWNTDGKLIESREYAEPTDPAYVFSQ